LYPAITNLIFKAGLELTVKKAGDRVHLLVGLGLRFVRGWDGMVGYLTAYIIYTLLDA
jgi:hypothetical protein